MDAREVLAYASGLVDFELGGAPFVAGAAGLHRTARLLDALGRPDDGFVVLQVAGTNGKGSTSAMLASILAASNGPVGLYTSPHLRRWEERVRIDGRVIDDAALAAAGTRVAEASKAMPEEARPTRFEFWTALACVAFARASCRAAVLEVGLGGRYDATTATRVGLAVLTRIALDHVAILGETLREIATEKAAIVGERMPVVSAPQEPEAEAVVLARAAAQHSRLLLGRRDFEWSMEPRGLAVRVADARYEGLAVPLRGPHQHENAATAVAAAHVARDLGLRVSAGSVARGIAAARWPGRFEVVGDVVVDGAHNPDGAAALRRALEAEFPGRHATFVVGSHRDKDLANFLAALVPVARRVIAVRADHPRARPAEDVVDAARTVGLDAEAGGTVAGGIRRAREGGGLVVVCGSLAVVGEARNALGLDDYA